MANEEKEKRKLEEIRNKEEKKKVYTYILQRMYSYFD